jgi:hypothetical protein
MGTQRGLERRLLQNFAYLIGRIVDICKEKIRMLKYLRLPPVVGGKYNGTCLGHFRNRDAKGLRRAGLYSIPALSEDLGLPRSAHNSFRNNPVRPLLAEPGNAPSIVIITNVST